MSFVYFTPLGKRLVEAFGITPVYVAEPVGAEFEMDFFVNAKIFVKSLEELFGGFLGFNKVKKLFDKVEKDVLNVKVTELERCSESGLQLTVAKFVVDDLFSFVVGIIFGGEKLVGVVTKVE